MRTIAIATTYPAERLRAADAIVMRLADLSVALAGEEIQINLTAPPTA
jgi:hypothetical protein